MSARKHGATGAPDVDAIRQQVSDLEHQAGDVEILMAAIFDKLDGMSGHTPSGLDAINAINCFATCALRNAALIKAAAGNIRTLAAEGGAV